MAINPNELWHEGFKAGYLFRSECPYPVHSREAEAWKSGWTAAEQRRAVLGRPSRSGVWQRLVRKLHSA